MIAMKMRSPATLLTGLMVLLALAGCASLGGGGGAYAGAPQGIGDPMPDMTLQEFWSKKQISLSSLRGKVVLLDIWASWCVPCKDEMPMLDDMAARLHGRGVEIIAVSIDEERPAAEEFLRRRRRWSLTIAHDPGGSVPNRLQPPKMPTSYLVDSNGILREVNAGFERADANRIEARLRELASAR
jgi:thiol-disulfide isomerase/thioredoxin